MAIFFEENKRNVIPNWRDFKRTLQLGELKSPNKSNSIRNIDISRPVNDWRNSKSIGIAADLINSAFVANKVDSNEVLEAIEFIKNNDSLSNKSLIEIAEKILNSDVSKLKKEKGAGLEVESFEELLSYIDNNMLFKLISKCKSITYKENKNPIIWVELSRLYSFIGQENKATNAMDIALHLAPNNRFVLRSATRLFVHFNQCEKALYYLKKSPTSQIDPWITSAHIATSTLINRYSPLIKNAKNTLISNNFSDFDLTELASTMGTLEYFEGSIKNTKKYFLTSLKSPNDNSLAQIEWISSREKTIFFNPFKYKHVSNAYEAFAYDNFEKELWESAFNNCIQWFLDIPYSKTPMIFGSYIACVFLNEYEKAIKLCEIGLKANPHDATLLNNLVYAFTITNQLDKARPHIEHLHKLKYLIANYETKTSIKATMGLVAFREKNIELGKKIYREVIDSAEKSKDENLKNLAICNYLRELILINDPEKDILIGHLKSIKSDSFDVKQMKKNIDKLLKESVFKI